MLLKGVLEGYNKCNITLALLNLILKVYLTRKQSIGNPKGYFLLDTLIGLSLICSDISQ